MPDPPDDDFTESSQAAPSGAQVQTQIKAVAAFPVAVGVALVEDVHFSAARQPEQCIERRRRDRTEFGVGLRIGADQAAIERDQLLTAKEQLRGAQYKGIIGLIQEIAQNDLDELVDEKMWKSAALTRDVEIRILERRVAQQVIPPSKHQLPIIARVDINYGGDPPGRNGLPGIGQQGVPQLQLRGAGVVWRQQLRPRKVSL